MKIKKYLFLIPHYISIMLQLHSNSPNEEIKNNWKILAIGGIPVVFLTLFLGEKIFGIFQLPEIEFINIYGGWIFLSFLIVYSIIFFDYKKCLEITAKQHRKSEKL
jgi:hypothetical protein